MHVLDPWTVRSSTLNCLRPIHYCLWRRNWCVPQKDRFDSVRWRAEEDSAHSHLPSEEKIPNSWEHNSPHQILARAAAVAVVVVVVVPVSVGGGGVVVVASESEDGHD